MEIKNLDRLFRKLNAMGGNAMDAVENAVKKTVLAAEETVKANVPSSKYSQADSAGSGSLRGSIAHDVKRTGTAVEGRVYSNSGHSVFVEMGTGPVGAANHAGISPHIHPRYTLRSAWTYPIIIGGEQTFRVTSGQPARPFMYPAAVEHKDTLPRMARIELIQAIERTAGGG